jgi:hypothetical protein
MGELLLTAGSEPETNGFQVLDPERQELMQEWLRAFDVYMPQELDLGILQVILECVDARVGPQI